MILSEGNDERIRDVVCRYGGDIIDVNHDLGIYRVRFPVADLVELVRFRDALVAEELDAMLSPRLEADGGPS